MSRFSKYAPTLKKYAPVAVAVGTMLVAGTASADVAADISTAVDTGKSNLVLVASGLVAMAAVMTAVSMVVSALRR